MATGRRRNPVIIATAVIVAMIGAAYVAMELWPKKPPEPDNSLFVLQPYKYAGTWVFDDPARKLKQEPFVAGIPKMIDLLVKDIPNADKGFRLLVSAQPFPGATHKLTWRREDSNGNWYWSEDFKFEGWLCPALIKFFKVAPKEIHFQAEPLTTPR